MFPWPGPIQIVLIWITVNVIELYWVFHSVPETIIQSKLQDESVYSCRRLTAVSSRKLKRMGNVNVHIYQCITLQHVACQLSMLAVTVQANKYTSESSTVLCIRRCQYLHSLIVKEHKIIDAVHRSQIQCDTVNPLTPRQEFSALVRATLYIKGLTN